MVGIKKIEARLDALKEKIVGVQESMEKEFVHVGGMNKLFKKKRCWLIVGTG